MERRPNQLSSDTAPQIPDHEALHSFEVPKTPKVPEKLKEAELALLAAKKQPEAKLAHVTEAAKRNEAVERLYELRHEVKDQAAPKSAVSVGQIVADAPSRQPGLAGISTDVSSTTKKQPNSQSSHQPTRRKKATYKRAMGIGFTVAIVFIIAIEVYMLLKG